MFLAWSALDQDKALAYEREVASLCQSCGTREQDWVDPETERPWYPPKWEAVPYACPGCDEMARRRRSLPDDAAAKGVIVHAAPFDPSRDYGDAVAFGPQDDLTGESGMRQ